jgi:putative inorganic carbon (hco3(-)) transporter
MLVAYTGSRGKRAASERTQPPTAPFADEWRSSLALVPVLLLVATSVFRLPEIYEPLLSLRLQLLSMLLTALGFTLSLSRNRQLFLMPEMKLILGFFLVSHLGILFSIRPGGSLTFAIESGYWKIVLFAILLSYLLSSRAALKWSSTVVVASGVVISAVVLIDYAQGNLGRGGRVIIGNANLNDANEIALHLLICWSFALALAIYGRSKIKSALGWVASATMLAAITATQSRGGFLGVLTVSAFFAFKVTRSKVVVSAGTLLLGAILVGVTSVGERFDRDGLIDGSAQGRLDYWSVALQTMILHPLTGVGMDSFWFVAWQSTGRDHAVHNTWLQIGAETGLPGLTIFGAALVCAVRSLLRASRDRLRSGPELYMAAVGALGAVAGTCVASTFLSEAYTWPLYFLLAVAAAAGRIANSRAVAAERGRGALALGPTAIRSSTV